MHSYTRPQFLAYLQGQLIPDFREADFHSTADDFETAAAFIAADSRALSEARSALKAATGHLRPDSNAAVLCENAIACIDGTQTPGEPTREELIEALREITERAEAVSQGIPVENRNLGVSQATHVSHMASHLAQHCKPARQLLNRCTP